MTSPPAHADAARVVLYTRPQCHLCDVAEQVVAEVCADTGDTWTSVDITGDDDLVRVDPERLKTALSS